METGPVLVALGVVALVAGLVAIRLQRSATRERVANMETPPAQDVTARLSTADRRFQLLSFQGGSVPADLGPVLEELRRNGIEVDEETLRRKLADGATTIAGLGGTGGDLDALSAGGTPGTAAVLSATDVPGGDGEEPGPDMVHVQVTLELRIAHREPIREQRVAVVHRDRRAMLTEGAAVPVRYDPDDPRAITLDWEIT